MKKFILIFTCISVLVGATSIQGGCQSQGNTSTTKKQGVQGSLQHSDATIVTQEYLQAVIENDTDTLNKLSPNFTQLSRRDVVSTIFFVGDVGKATIIQGSALTAEEYKKAMTNRNLGTTIDPETLDISTMQQKLIAVYGASDVVFFQYKVKETAGQKRDLSAYVTALKTKTGYWVAAPGLGEGFYSFEPPGYGEIK